MHVVSSYSVMPSMNMSAFCRSVVCPFNTSKGMYLRTHKSQRRQSLPSVLAQPNIHNTGIKHCMTPYMYSPSITLFNIALPVAAAGGGQTKITKLVDCFINNVDVVWLDIHVDHVSGVHMLQRQANLQSQSHAQSTHA